MPAVTSFRWRSQVGWDDVPHLDEKTKRELLQSYLPHEREARTKGEPSLGSGAVYPVPWGEIESEPFKIPPYWKTGFAMDVGWQRTAALWGAVDPSTHVMYLFGEYYRGQELPIVHANGIKLRGDWIKGAIDPAARGRGQDDGKQLFQSYRDLGLRLTLANNAVDAGIYEVWQRLSIGRLKVFRTLVNFKDEYRFYQRDEKGQIVKRKDHLMDCLRYLVMTWDAIAAVEPPPTLDVTPSAGVADRRAGY